jgi:hypothetical protein
LIIFVLSFDGSGGESADEEAHTEQEHDDKWDRRNGVSGHQFAPFFGVFAFDMVCVSKELQMDISGRQFLIFYIIWGSFQLHFY